MTRTGRLVAIISAFALLGAGCHTQTTARLTVTPLPARADSIATTSRAKIHLLDGSTVMYDSGFTIVRDSVRGTGVRYGLSLSEVGTVHLVPADSVAAIEAFVVTEESEKTNDLAVLGMVVLGILVVTAIWH